MPLGEETSPKRRLDRLAPAVGRVVLGDWSAVQIGEDTQGRGTLAFRETPCKHKRSPVHTSRAWKSAEKSPLRHPARDTGKRPSHGGQGVRSSEAHVQRGAPGTQEKRASSSAILPQVLPWRRASHGPPGACPELPVAASSVIGKRRGRQNIHPCGGGKSGLRDTDVTNRPDQAW